MKGLFEHIKRFIPSKQGIRLWLLFSAISLFVHAPFFGFSYFIEAVAIVYLFISYFLVLFSLCLSNFLFFGDDWRKHIKGSKIVFAIFIIQPIIGISISFIHFILIGGDSMGVLMTFFGFFGGLGFIFLEYILFYPPFPASKIFCRGFYGEATEFIGKVTEEEFNSVEALLKKSSLIPKIIEKGDIKGKILVNNPWYESSIIFTFFDRSSKNFLIYITDHTGFFAFPKKRAESLYKALEKMGFKSNGVKEIDWYPYNVQTIHPMFGTSKLFLPFLGILSILPFILSYFKHEQGVLIPLPIFNWILTNYIALRTMSQNDPILSGVLVALIIYSILNIRNIFTGISSAKEWLGKI